MNRKHQRAEMALHPDDFPARTWERISEGVRHHQQRFMREAGQ